ncbi:MAG: hypothetical protein QNJ29_01220 [Rhizobiaceae bacterium]|nr:hypothetical protein [Rhizobiaceae bacterium]
MTPNAKRFDYHYKDLDEANRDEEILTITKWDANWKKINEFQNLVELTIHEANQDMLRFPFDISSVRRLRITHARPKALSILHHFSNLEELILEYVSSFNDLSDLSCLSNLKALHIENVRNVRDFSGIGLVPSLEYLCIDGTFDWTQPIENLEFLRNLRRLQLLRLVGVRVLAESEIFRPLLELSVLKKLHLSRGQFLLEDYAFVEANLPHVEGSVLEPISVDPARNEYFYPPDLRARLPLGELEEMFPEVEEDGEGRRYEPRSEYTFFWGRGDRTLVGNSPKILERRKEYIQRYNALVQQFKKEQ